MKLIRWVVSVLLSKMLVWSLIFCMMENRFIIMMRLRNSLVFNINNIQSLDLIPLFQEWIKHLSAKSANQRASKKEEIQIIKHRYLHKMKI